MELSTLDPRRLVCSIYRLWLAIGALATLVLPGARGADPLLGAWPVWLVVLPAGSLLALRWTFSWRHSRESGNPA